MGGGASKEEPEQPPADHRLASASFRRVLPHHGGPYFYSPTVAPDGSCVGVYYNAPAVGGTRWYRRASVSKRASVGDSGLRADGHPEPGVAYYNAPYGVTTTPEGLRMWVDSSGETRYALAAPGAAINQHTGRLYNTSAVSVTQPTQVHRYPVWPGTVGQPPPVTSTTTTYRHWGPPQQTHFYPRATLQPAPGQYHATQQAVFDTYQTPHRTTYCRTPGYYPPWTTVSCPTVQTETVESVQMSTQDGTQQAAEEDIHDRAAVPTTVGGTSQHDFDDTYSLGSFGASEDATQATAADLRNSANGHIRHTQQTQEARQAPQTEQLTEVECFSFGTETPGGTTTTQTVAEFTDDISSHLRNVPMTIHTMRLPPGVSPDDERLQHASVVSERTYQSGTLKFREDEGFQAYVHPALVTPKGKTTNRTVVPDTSAEM